jgi:hypothetical protein
MIKRKFLKLAGILGFGLMTIFYIEPWFIRKLYYKIESLFKSPVKLPAQDEREGIQLSRRGYSVPVEMALNSRCNSDNDGNPKRFHWGMFDGTKRLSDDQVKEIIGLSRIPRLTDQRVEIQWDGNILTFVLEIVKGENLRDWMMIESGMQQQAVGLVCAALGVGIKFRNQGENGTPISDTCYATTKMRLDPMKPSYNESFWTSSSPSKVKPWRRGNLPDPVRDGNEPLISALQHLKTEKKRGRELTDRAMGQLLWSSRGRTPHFYKSRPWGMTIPTARGEQDISSVYLISDYKLSRYLNWRKNRPTHSVEVIGDIDVDLYNKFMKIFPLHNCVIVIGKNKQFAMAFWEIGYQLLNLMLQAHALKLIYKAILLDENQQKIFQSAGIKNPVAAIMLRQKS